MIRINLLPHRAERRAERKRQFFVLAGLSVVLAALIGYAVHMVIDGEIQTQEARNAFLTQEIKALDEQIVEIKSLREQIEALLQRKQIIESLQASRSDPVHVLNELLKGMPESVYLKSVKQSGRKITLNGYAQSNSRVSHLMRQLGLSDYLEQPVLVEVKAVTVEGRRLSEFTMSILLAQPQKADGKER